MAQYIIGIDLGTTNSVLAYVAADAEAPELKLLPVPQVVAAGTVESRTSLPSFLYLPTEAERTSGAFALPWTKSGADVTAVVGEFARKQAADVPDRTVGATKSWLAHHAVDRKGPILPWGAGEDVPKISPLAASQAFLQHLVAAWEHAFPDAPIARQQVALTVPASFDASARELTREAAIAAGAPHDLILLEEPQAAVYAWLDDRGEKWRKELGVGAMLLVCDVGGGTTDFTLVTVREEDGELTLERKAVGNHLLVGGDNMDLALAYQVSQRFAEKGVTLDPWQSVSLWHSCRAAKERLLEADGPETEPITVLGRGSKLIGGTISVDMEREHVAELLVDGFFPTCAIDTKPARTRASGFAEIGLPFESETAVTRHLAGFLSAHGDGGPIMPSHVLFNGGVFRAERLRRRLLDVLAAWFPENTPAPVEGPQDLDHAVARGAAYYGWAKTHGGVRIRGGTGRAYYVGVETAGLAIPGAPRPLRALCVASIGMEEGTEADVPGQELAIVVGEPAQFRFFSSATRKEDHPGLMLPNVNGLEESDALEATLGGKETQGEDVHPVRFKSRVTELGMFELWCLSARGAGEWKLEFNVREEA